MKKLLLLLSLIISIDSAALYLHNDDEVGHNNTLSSWCDEKIDESINFLSEKGLKLSGIIKRNICQNTLIGSSEIIDESINFLSEKGLKLFGIINRNICQNTLIGSSEIEEEYINRKHSVSYQNLQSMSFIAVPIVGLISSYSGIENLIFLQLPSFCFFYGIEIADYFVDASLSEMDDKSEAKEALDIIKSIRSIVLVSLFPTSFAGALFIDKLGNEVAARCTHSLNCSETKKDLIFFSVKNIARALVYFDMLEKVTIPPVGKSDFPKDFSYDPRELRSLATSDYGIHLMWVNKEIKNTTFVFPDRDLHNTPILDHIFGWAKKGGADALTFWFDSSFTTHEQVNATADLFALHNLLCGENCTPVELRDVTTLDFYKNNLDTLAKAGIWIVTDTLRLALLIETLTKSNSLNVQVFQDLDNIPFRKKWMLDLETLKKLSKYGTVLHQRAIDETDAKYSENSLIMMANTGMFNLQSYQRMLKNTLEELAFDEPRSGYNFVYDRLLRNLREWFNCHGWRTLPTKNSPTINTAPSYYQNIPME